MYHQVEYSITKTIEEKKVDETKKISLAIDAGFGFDTQDVGRDSHHMSYLSGLCNEEKKYRKYIKHLNDDTACHYLVELS